MIKKYLVSMQSTELYEVEAENEEEAYEMIALGEVEPIAKEYFGDDDIREVNDE
jgi:hypothetical protein